LLFGPFDTSARRPVRLQPLSIAGRRRPIGNWSMPRRFIAQDQGLKTGRRGMWMDRRERFLPEESTRLARRANGKARSHVRCLVRFSPRPERIFLIAHRRAILCCTNVRAVKNGPRVHTARQEKRVRRNEIEILHVAFYSLFPLPPVYPQRAAEETGRIHSTAEKTTLHYNGMENFTSPPRFYD